MVGIGDMSGDVFGNGMLLSQHLALVAAFDHRHVFLDPTPDAGGGVRRAAAAVRLPGHVVGRLRPLGDLRGRRRVAADARSRSRSRRRPGRCSGIAARALPPDELIRAILRAPVDLLWNGGIGTFVKASAETHAEVGDRANDAVRVDGRELRCTRRRRGRQPRLHPARPDRVRARRRAHQHRRDRQLGRRRLLRPRGQPEDPARAWRSSAAS